VLRDAWVGRMGIVQGSEPHAIRPAVCHDNRKCLPKMLQQSPSGQQKARQLMVPNGFPPFRNGMHHAERIISDCHHARYAFVGKSFRSLQLVRNAGIQDIPTAPESRGYSTHTCNSLPVLIAECNRDGKYRKMQSTHTANSS
jgi:hypothetical protein